MDGFQEAFGHRLEAFPASLGPIFEGLNGILAQRYKRFDLFSKTKVGLMGGLLGQLSMASWLILGFSGPRNGLQNQLRICSNTNPNFDQIFADLLIDFLVSFIIQKGIKTASKLELEIDLVLERLFPARRGSGRVVLFQVQVLVLA